MRKEIIKQNPNIIVSFGESSNVYAIFLKLFVMNKVVVCMRQDPERVNAIIMSIVKLFYNYADHILIVQTKYQKDGLQIFLNHLKLLT